MAVRAGYRSPFQRCPALRPTLDFPSSRRRWGFLVFPQAHCCHFPFRTHGVSLLSPGGVTETKGASPSYTLPPQLCPCAGPPGTNSQGSISTGQGTMQKGTGEGKGRAGWHLPIPDQFPLQRPPVVAALSPTSQATDTPPCQVPSILRLMLTRPWLVFLTSPSPAVVLEAWTLCPFPDHSHS